MKDLNVGLIQLATYSNKQERLNIARKQIREAANQGADIVCLPELMNLPGDSMLTDRTSYYNWAETIHGSTIEIMRSVALKEGITIVAPIYEKDDKYYYNSAVVINPDGNVQGIYRKVSLGTPEQFFYLPGDKGFQVFTELKTGWNFGILICYDRHFPEAMRVLALKGADIVFIPTASAKGVWTEKIWETELQYHALNNRFYIAAVNRVGEDLRFSKCNSFFGKTLFISPVGKIICQSSSNNCELLQSVVQKQDLDKARHLGNFLLYRRPELYKDLVL